MRERVRQQVAHVHMGVPVFAQAAVHPHRAEAARPEVCIRGATTVAEGRRGGACRRGEERSATNRLPLRLMPFEHRRELGRPLFQHLQAVVQLLNRVGGAHGGAQAGHAFGDIWVRNGFGED